MLRTVIALALAFGFVACAKKTEPTPEKKPETPAVQADAAPAPVVDAAAPVPAADAAVPAPAADAAAPVAPAGATAPLDMSGVGLAASIDAPAGAAVKEEFGSYVVTKEGTQFQLEISAQKADLAQWKTDIEGNTVNKLKTFHVQDDTTLLYETEVMGKVQFHFVANVNKNGKDFSCQDLKGAMDYTRADVDAMLAACKTIAPK